MIEYGQQSESIQPRVEIFGKVTARNMAFCGNIRSIVESERLEISLAYCKVIAYRGDLISLAVRPQP